MFLDFGTNLQHLSKSALTNCELFITCLTTSSSDVEGSSLVTYMCLKGIEVSSELVDVRDPFGGAATRSDDVDLVPNVIAEVDGVVFVVLFTFFG